MFRDMLSRAIVTQHLHASAFVNSDVIRVLVPFHLDWQSPFVDCSISYAQWWGYSRDSLVGGARVSDVFAPTNFQRMFEVLSMLTRCPVLFVRNVPNYASNTTSDIVASLEHEQSGAGHGSGTPRKLLQLMFLNLRPLDVPSAVAVGTHWIGANGQDKVIEDAYTGRNAASISSSVSEAEAVPDQSWLTPTPTEHKSSNFAMGLAGVQQAIWASQQLPPPTACSSESHVIVITPQYELGDADGGPGLELSMDITVGHR